MKRWLADLRAAFSRVFAEPAYIALAGVLALIAFLVAVWFPNFGLLAEVLATQAPLGDRLAIALGLLGGIATNFSPLAAGYTIAIAGLFGLCAAMITHLLRRGRTAAAGRNIAIGSGGVASGVVGIGCAACGSLVLGGVLPFTGAAAALAALPLGGGEFGILGVVLLFVSLLLVSRAIAQPADCALSATARAGRQ